LFIILKKREEEFKMHWLHKIFMTLFTFLTIFL
jgi:hypothetical protein